MKTLGLPSFKASMPSFQMMPRPKTAQPCSYKKLTDFLEGRFIEIKANMTGRKINRSLYHKANKSQVKLEYKKPYRKYNKSQTPSERDRKELKNDQNGKQNDFNGKNRTKQENLDAFLPYSLQEKTFLPQNWLNIKKISKNSKKTQDSTKNQRISYMARQEQGPEKWKNEDEQSTNLSSLFPNTWKF